MNFHGFSGLRNTTCTSMHVVKQKYTSCSIMGVNKKSNQDNLLIIQNGHNNLYAVFDGLGSAINSKKATNLAKQFIRNSYKDYTLPFIKLDEMMNDCNKYILSKKIPYALTTYCIAVMPHDQNDEMVYSSMGDSRIYIITKQYIEQITHDDRLENSKFTLTKCLGLENLKITDFKQYYFKKSNTSTLLCSDGFYNFLEENRLLFFQLLSKIFMKNIKKDLHKILSGKNSDDCSYIYVK